MMNLIKRKQSRAKSSPSLTLVVDVDGRVTDMTRGKAFIGDAGIQTCGWKEN